jgi:hypothetical protein
VVIDEFQGAVLTHWLSRQKSPADHHTYPAGSEECRGGCIVRSRVRDVRDACRPCLLSHGRPRVFLTVVRGGRAIHPPLSRPVLSERSVASCARGSQRRESSRPSQGVASDFQLHVGRIPSVAPPSRVSETRVIAPRSADGAWPAGGAGADARRPAATGKTARGRVVGRGAEGQDRPVGAERSRGAGFGALCANLRALLQAVEVSWLYGSDREAKARAEMRLFRDGSS